MSKHYEYQNGQELGKLDLPKINVRQRGNVEYGALLWLVVPAGVLGFCIWILMSGLAVRIGLSIR